ncbi:uncharacterized protein LOC102714508 isoform X2 [Oryza brachyantha]|uniref:uncharacterized protein LOC102714508 isoform X2 n=1 Tax=Oryza brachyantha TaxID=4533 RepID=UPI001ADCCA61|nr:uncharacterized protein LOC102714508 isoform X2 [Oryza brachyantha]
MTPRDNGTAAVHGDNGEEKTTKKKVVTCGYICDDPVIFFVPWGGGMRKDVAYGMWLLSLVYAVLSLYLLLWRVPGDQPLTWVCAFSLLLCSYMFFWIISLSAAITKLAAFTGITYGVLLASAAGQVLGPVAGMAAVVLDLIITTGVLGHAVAEHRQRTGSEKAAAAQLTWELTAGEDEGFYVDFLPSFVVLGASSVFALAGAAWLVVDVVDRLPPDDPVAAAAAVFDVSLGTWIVSCQWSMLLFTAVLREPFAVINEGNTVSCMATACSAGLFMLAALLLAVFVCKIPGILVVLLSPMAMTGFLGYLVAVYSHYRQASTQEA